MSERNELHQFHCYFDIYCCTVIILSQFCRSLLVTSGQQLCKFLGTKECFYMRREFNSRRIIVLYTNIAGVTFCENNLYSKVMKPQTSSRPLSTLDVEAGFMLQHAKKVVSNSLGASRFCYQGSEFCSYARRASDVYGELKSPKNCNQTCSSKTVFRTS